MLIDMCGRRDIDKVQANAKRIGVLEENIPYVGKRKTVAMKTNRRPKGEGAILLYRLVARLSESPGL